MNRVDRIALIVGVDRYDNFRPLRGCTADVCAMADVLAKNDDGAANFKCKVLTTNSSTGITRASLRIEWSELFSRADSDVLFYFSGHGAPTALGGHLVTEDGTRVEPGLAMSELVFLANRSRARTVLIILDCCFSGSASSELGWPGSLDNEAKLREGVTILAASRSTEVALEQTSGGVFTKLLLGALRGGAADLRGRVSAASMYAYAEAALGAWDQRPLYKSHAARLEPVRLCTPTVSDSLLRELPTFFTAEDSVYALDKTYEESSSQAIQEHVTVFKKFKQLQVAGLLKPEVGTDLYWTAIRSENTILTPLGQFYRALAEQGRI